MTAITARHLSDNSRYLAGAFASAAESVSASIDVILVFVQSSQSFT